MNQDEPIKRLFQDGKRHDHDRDPGFERLWTAARKHARQPPTGLRFGPTTWVLIALLLAAVLSVVWRDSVTPGSRPDVHDTAFDHYNNLVRAQLSSQPLTAWRSPTSYLLQPVTKPPSSFEHLN